MIARKRKGWKLREAALDRTLWITRFGKGCEPVARQKQEKILSEYLQI
jgi:hypothetical protein